MPWDAFFPPPFTTPRLHRGWFQFSITFPVTEPSSHCTRRPDANRSFDDNFPPSSLSHRCQIVDSQDLEYRNSTRRPSNSYVSMFVARRRGFIRKWSRSCSSAYWKQVFRLLNLFIYLECCICLVFFFFGRGRRGWYLIILFWNSRRELR